MLYSLTDSFGKLPFVRITTPFLLGILLGECYSQQVLDFTWMAIAAGSAYLLLCFYRQVVTYSFRWVWGVPAFVFLLFGGIAVSQQQKKESELPLEETVVLNAVVIEHPVQKPKTMQLQLRVDEYKQHGNWAKARENVVVYIRLDGLRQVPEAGQRIIFSADLQPIRPPMNPEEFDYRRYMQRSGFYATALVGKGAYEVVDEAALPFYKSIPLRLQKGLLNVFKKVNIDGQELAVLMALTIGDTQLLDSDLRQAYASVGIIHILSVSGLHVGLLYALLTYALFFLRGKRYKVILKAVAILIGLWLYAAVAGFSPSVTRATVMFSFVLFARLSGRQASTLNAVFASAFFICLFNPLSLFDIGFQLSYLAVLGILSFYSKLSGLIALKNPILRGVWSICCVSFGAQLAVLPLSVFYFHQLPTYFLLANMLVIPLVAVATYLIVLLLLLSFIPILAVGVGYLLNICIWMVNYTVAAVQGLLCAAIADIYISPLHLVLCLLAIVFLMLVVHFRKRALLLSLIGCVVLVLALGFAYSIKTGRQQQLVVFCTDYASVMAIIDGRKALCIKDDKNFDQSFDYNTKGYFIKQQISSKAIHTVAHSKLDGIAFSDGIRYYKGLFWFAGKSIKLLSQTAKLHSTGNPFPIDILIVTNGCGMLPDEALSLYPPKLLVLDSSVSSRRANGWIEVLNKHQISYHNIREKGSFILDID